MMPDPILVGRDADKVERSRKRFNVARWTTDLDKALADKSDSIFFDAATTQARAVAADQGDQRRQARLLREADRRPISTRRSRCSGSPTARGVKHGTVQDKLFLPGLKKLAFLRDSGFFGRITLGARRIRLLGVRGRLAGGAAAVVELPQRGRRRHHPRHGLPLALRARQSVRRGRERELPRHDATFPSAGTRRAAKYKATADDSAYATFRLKGGVIAHINMSWVTRVYRDDLVTFQVDGTLGSAVAGLPNASSRRARRRRGRCGIPTRSGRTISMPTGRSCRRTPPTTTASRSSGRCSSATSARTRRTNTRC